MILAFDTETYLLDERNKIPRPVCCTWADAGREWISRPGDAVTYKHITDPETVFVGVFIAFDILGMTRWHPWTIPHFIRALDEGRVFDCGTREKMLYLASKGANGYNPFPSMEDMAFKYLNIDLSEEKKNSSSWRLRYGTLDGVPLHKWPKESLDYALKDARHTYDIFQSQGGVGNTQPTESWQVQGSVCLAAIGAWGVKVNKSKQAELYQRQNSSIEAAQERIGPYGWTGKGSKKRLQQAVSEAFAYKQAMYLKSAAEVQGIQIDWNLWNNKLKDKCLNRYLESYVGMKIGGGHIPPLICGWPDNYSVTTVMYFLEGLIKNMPSIPMTKTGPSVAESTLKQVYDINDSLRMLVDLKHERKMVSTYLDNFNVDVSHGRYTDMVKTGRTACSPPHQTIPREGNYRAQFCPREGFLYGTVDYTMLELCTLAASIRVWWPNAYCVLGDLIDQGYDVHCYTAALILGKSYAEVAEHKTSIYKEGRQKGKAVNFGKPGGLGLGAFMHYAENTYGVKMDFAEARKVTSAWEQAFPEIPNIYLSWVSKMVDGVENKGVARTIWGRSKARSSYTEIANYSFQALAADGAKASMYAIWREIMLSWYYNYSNPSNNDYYGKDFACSPLKDSHLAIFVHDELAAEHPHNKQGEEAFARQKELMVQHMTLVCQGKITIRVEGKLDLLWDH